MPVSSATIQQIDAKFLKLDRQFHSNTVAGTTPDCEREFAALRKAIQDARLEDANEPKHVAHAKANPTAPEQPVKPVVVDPVPPFFPGAFVDKPVETETDGA